MTGKLRHRSSPGNRRANNGLRVDGGNNNVFSIESGKATLLDYTDPISGIILNILDMGLNIDLAYECYKENATWYCGLTITAICLPTIANVVISLIMDHKNSQNKDGGGNISMAREQYKLLTMIIYLLKSVPVLHYGYCIYYAFKSRTYEKEGNEHQRQIYYEKMKIVNKDFSRMRTVERCCGNIPRLVLRLYIQLQMAMKSLV